MRFKKILIAVMLGLAGCGPNYHYEEAAKLEKQGLLLRAAEHYHLFADKSPAEKLAPEALFKAAEIYSRELSLCSSAAPVYEKLLKGYPSAPQREAAYKGLFVCPDYFPVDRFGAWAYGDSQTGGTNARQNVRVIDIKKDAAYTLTSIFAGRQLVSKQRKNYKFTGGFEFIENQGGFDTIILKYPVSKGASWETVSAGRKVKYTVAGTGLKIKVRAGVFEGCIKVKQQLADFAGSWIYEYYAPWTGKILTSVAGPGYENRLLELLKYEKEQTKRG